MDLHIQRYLRSGGTFEALFADHKVKARRHGTYPNLVLFKYAVLADFHDPMVRECRGIILDEADDWRVINRTFDKFGNAGESYAAEIDWSTARVQEKADGSIIQLFHYNGAWHVATSGSPDASGTVERAGDHVSEKGASGNTFADYFWETFFDVEGGILPKRGDCEDFCFAFELMGPLNRIVVVHEQPSLRLLGVRNRVTGREYSVDMVAHEVNIAPVRSFPLTSLDEIRASFDHISPVSQEGYVVVDAAFNRIKVKHPGYVALHHAKDGLGPKAFVEIARTGEVSEVLAAFPEFRPVLESTQAKYDALADRIRVDYARLANIETQKAFALEALQSPWSAALFAMRKGVELGDFLRGLPVEKVMTWMGLEDGPTDNDPDADGGGDL
jgi:RNA ligase